MRFFLKKKNAPIYLTTLLSHSIQYSRYIIETKVWLSHSLMEAQDVFFKETSNNSTSLSQFHKV